MSELPGWDWFLRIVERGSISGAARDLDQTPAALSMALKRLEGQLGVQLFQRSTRKLTLTHEGEIWYRSTRAAQDALAQGLDELAGARGELAGPLRIAAPSDFGRQFVLDWLDGFCRLHPAIVPSLVLADRVDDLVADSLDLAVRAGIPQDANLIATALAPDNRRVLVASPAYWAQHGMPRHPDELAAHHCLAFSIRDTPHVSWRFAQGDVTTTVQVRPRRYCNDGAVVSDWARRGWGVAYKSRLDVANDLAAGRLVAALPDWLGEPTPLYLVRNGSRHALPRVLAFRDYCLMRMQALQD
ncbi:DNA-binding transcriptional regulator, LysR family [Andreprevotia lacus DSM 23236]|jgi:DNA-binding transcriptional LysR family regulator|uniref:DNA-binding transcriptional regulator, LysR family n=1 Tax=Andreprevotia lacus DSM 23236 TaxID=1121001 RepID=A0A1W1X460_9NEIS|nr:LysR family transcriptional regulator [Andreprevotia lacus]SMC18667.1 DNA-binding transcriptional regulator, LysR family [Andreprevotia lacus DSM 23236]